MDTTAWDLYFSKRIFISLCSQPYVSGASSAIYFRSMQEIKRIDDFISKLLPISPHKTLVNNIL